MKQQYKVTFGEVKIGKKTTIAVEIKGHLSDEQKLDLISFANSDGFIQLATAQRDIDDYVVKAPPHEGISYKLLNNEIQVDHNQLDIEDVISDGDGKEERIAAAAEKTLADQEAAATEEEMKAADEELKEIEEYLQEQNEGDIPDSLDDGDEVEQVNVEVIKGFTYQSKKVKKGDVLQMPKDTAEGLADYVKILTITESELPF